jgi:hypothetical protein
LTVTALLAFVVMLVVVAAMAIGVLLGRRPIEGSCGGMARLGLGECEVCGGDPARCERRIDGPGAGSAAGEGTLDPDLGYDASGRARRDF